MKVFLPAILLGMFAIIAITGVNLLQASGDYDVLQLKTASGNENSAAFFKGTGDQVVIFVPGAVFDKESWFFLAEKLKKMHVSSLSLDGKTPDSVLAAVNYLKKKGFKKIDLVGGSMGGAAVLGALGRQVDENINKVITLAPAGGDPIKNEKIQKLFIVSKQDSLGLYPEVKSLFNESSDPKKFAEIEGSAHAQHIFKGPHKAELTQLIVDFITN